MNGVFVYFKLPLLALICLVVLCSCGGENSVDNRVGTNDDTVPKPSTPPPTSPEVDFNETEIGKQIRQEYFDALIDLEIDWIVDSVTIDDVLIKHYYGIHNGFDVVYMDVIGIGRLDVVTVESIDNIQFCYPSAAFKILVWEEGRFYRLQEAYDLDLLTRENLLDIANQHYDIYACHY